MNIKKNLTRHRTVVENFSYITLLQLFVLIAPLVLYPYLIRVLGAEIYGWVILSQVIVAYCSIFVDFGFNDVSARLVALNKSDRQMIGEIVSSILFVRSTMWIICFLIYLVVIFSFASYRQHWVLFVIAYGLTLKDLLFLQFYFQGTEKMKFVTLVSMAARIISLFLIMVFVKKQSQYILVPALISFGYLVGGFYSMFLVFKKEKIPFVIPRWQTIKICTKDASLLLSTNLITTIKDKLNYILLASCVAVDQIVIYDLGSKFNALLSKPASIISMVLLPKFSVSRNVRAIKRIMKWLFLFVFLCVLIFNIFMPPVVEFFLKKESVDLLPIRLYSMAPIFLSVSIYIANNVMTALGELKYLVYSIVVTTIAYLFLLGAFFCLGRLDTVAVFVFITLLSFIVEMIYRLWVANKIFAKQGLDKRFK